MQGIVGLGVVVHVWPVLLGVHVVVFSQGIAYEITTQVEPSHVGMSDELDAEEVVNFTFQQVGSLPKVSHRWQVRVLAVGGNDFNRDEFVGLSVLKNIDTPETFLPKVFTNDGDEEVEMFFIS